MDTALRNLLNEQERDALRDLYMHHYMPDILGVAGLNMITPDHLDRYFKTDTQATSAVATSFVAEAQACTVSHIHSIFDNIEPGYDTDFPAQLKVFWAQAMSNHSVWAAYQLLEDYPENYIRYDLRLDATALFKQLLVDLGQGRLKDETIYSAVRTYLKGYEQQNSIRVLSGFIDYRGGYQDGDHYTGYTFANSDYYLLGSDTASPPRYSWRKAKVRLDQGSTHILPDAWSEWQDIKLPAGGTVLEARLLRFAGRLQLVWLQHDARVEVPVDAPGEPSDDEPKLWRYPLKLQLVYLGLDEQWSAPEVLWAHDELVPVKQQDGEEVAPTFVAQLLATAVERVRGSDDQMLVALKFGVDVAMAAAKEVFTLQRDVLKRVIATNTAFSATARGKLFTYFFPGAAAGKRYLQRRLADAEYELKTVKRDPPLAEKDPRNPYLSLEAYLEQRGDKHRLSLRGRSSEVRAVQAPAWVYLSHVAALDNGNQLRVEVSTGPNNELWFSCAIATAPTGLTVVLKHAGLAAEVVLDTFSASAYGWAQSSKPVKLTNPSQLATYTLQQIKDGAGFEFMVAGGTFTKLVNGNNFITVHPQSDASVKMKLSTSGSTSWEGEVTLNGAAASPWIELDWDTSQTNPLKVTWRPSADKDPEGDFSVTVVKHTDPTGAWVPYLESQGSGVDFLVFDKLGNSTNSLAVRLNSLQVTDLINRAEVSPQAVFAWEAQHLREPLYQSTLRGDTYLGWQRSDEDPALGYFDAYGLYLRELFFHVPQAIASRLQEEQRFAEARDWLGLIFNPQRRQPATEMAGVDYWGCAWLLQDDTEAPGLEHQLVDPHVIALHAPSHYRKAVFLQYVQLLIDEGDLEFRQQTRASVKRAEDLYLRAKGLMGEAPDARTVSTWEPATLAQVLETGPDEAALLRHEQGLQPANLPKRLDTFLWVGAAAHPAFRLPINQQLLDVWQVLDHRQYNLRHFLSIDGNPMQLPLYDPVANPFDLLLARMGGAGGPSHLQGHRMLVPPYRFRTVVAKAQETVAALMQFGEQLRGFMEMEERTQLEALQFEHAAQIAGYVIGIQEQLHEQQAKTLEALEAQRSVVAVQRDHYRGLLDKGLSAQEIAAMTLTAHARLLSTSAGVMQSAGQALTAAPNVFGLANGGMNFGAALMALGYGGQIWAGAEDVAAGILRETAGYQRREQDWRLQLGLAEKNLQAIDKQLQAQKHATLAANRALLHSRQLLAQAQQLHQFYQNKSTSASLYGWLRAQASGWYATCFDVAVSLCNAAEACWQFETGRYDTRILRPVVWRADRYGLNAFGDLKMDLERLLQEWLMRNERQLEIRKDVSLQALLQAGLVCKETGEAYDPKKDTLQSILTGKGELWFTLSEDLYNEDYPGHYQRRLHSLALSMPALMFPYQNMRVELRQSQSQLLTKPDIEGVRYLSAKATTEPVNDRNVMLSLRPGQRTCHSTADRDTGMFNFDPGDERYFPYEGSGAVSTWHLRLPRHASQGDLLASLSDIIVHVAYHALRGDSQFEQEVEDLLEAVPPRAAGDAAVY
ncbi:MULTISPECIES: neuraminidase-like domain-containing protein [unclassified Pseudomonas]|uniref:Tc toxin subunit A-related protein n=1 Tax=unclassified Pseudomonas TaxID=196821 RepID=UPI002098152B|nr:MULTISPECIES: neuraminidase-like domain-containing protein [unclassified Pseudomonas]MCO7520851.1 neuraminidase-like domain-containing protein [Pseudomonas sp. 1]MCO7542764.1 neuraminidase-like domain-containing protein [Pseudomonas sp. VA159-2]